MKNNKAAGLLWLFHKYWKLWGRPVLSGWLTCAMQLLKMLRSLKTGIRVGYPVCKRVRKMLWNVARTEALKCHRCHFYSKTVAVKVHYEDKRTLDGIRWSWESIWPSASHCCLVRSLGIDEWLVSLVQSMYKDATTVVRVNGHDSCAFWVRVGVHKVSLLSPLLFVKVLEALSWEFREDLPMELLYADDLV